MYGTTLAGTSTLLDESAVKELQENLRGRLIRPGDEDYERARKVWNGRIDKRPALIARCTGVADVVQAVRFARTRDLLLAIRCGGHNAAGHGTCDGGLVLDLSPMKGIRVDRAARRVHAQGGVCWGELDRETQIFGLATTGGTVSDTGIAGLTLGGGIGWLMGSYGLACDNLISADVVLANVDTFTASAYLHPDLFWALRGGGGNFGVVTSFEYQLHPVGELLAGLVIYPRSQARDILRYHRDFSQSAPDEVVSVASLMTATGGEPVIAIAVCYNGSLAHGERVLAALHDWGTPLLDTVGPKSYIAVQSLLDPAVFPHGIDHYWKSSFLRNPSDTALDIAVECAARITSPMSMLLLNMLHGAVSRVPPEATAFGLRGDLWNLDVIAQWTNPAEEEQHSAWVRECWNALQPFSTGGVYVNHLGAEEPERVRAAYGHNYDRLAAVKRQYDPTNFFRVNQNIKPIA